MVKFLKPGKVVILLSGRYAGKKAVIVQNKDDGSSLRPYGHAIVVGLAKEPRKVIRKISQKKQARRSSIKVQQLPHRSLNVSEEEFETFVKTVNYQHMMPTRYNLDVDLKNVISAEALETATKKVEARKEAKKLLEDKFKSGKNRWFFTKLRF